MTGIGIARSLPSWECGLKCKKNGSKARYGGVAPFVGVWIEIAEEVSRSTAKKVAPFVGVWIEIFVYLYFSFVPYGRSLRGSVD